MFSSSSSSSSKCFSTLFMVWPRPIMLLISGGAQDMECEEAVLFWLSSQHNSLLYGATVKKASSGRDEFRFVKQSVSKPCMHDHTQTSEDAPVRPMPTPRQAMPL